MTAQVSLLVFEKIFLSAAQRMLVLYLIAFALLYAVVDQNKMRMRILSHRMIPLEYLLSLTEGQETPRREKLEEYVDYYQTVVDYVPHLAEGYGLLGLCYYYLGEEERARDLLERAVQLNPQYFWFHYNLGVMHYQNKDFSGAAESFKKALAVRPQWSVYLIYSSRLLSHIRDEQGVKVVLDPSDQETAQRIRQNLRDGYTKARELLVVSQQALQSNIHPTVDSKRDLTLRIF